MVLGSERDDPVPRLAFHLLGDRLVPDEGDLLDDGECSGVEVDVFVPQSACFAAAESAVEDEEVEGVEG